MLATALSFSSRFGRPGCPLSRCGRRYIIAMRHGLAHHRRAIPAFLLAHGRLQRTEGYQPMVYVTEVLPLRRAVIGTKPRFHTISINDWLALSKLPE